MTTEELDEWGADFMRFCARFADVFGRKEPRAQAVKYLRGLMASVPRKNGWQVAEVIGDRIPDVPGAVECGCRSGSPAEIHD